MITRRTFNGILGGGLMIHSSLKGYPKAKQAEPVVVSTWNNEEANRIALENLIENGPSVLDAIEAGIKAVEANPEDQSVGYGGRPDRLGKVTLDACIMDSTGNAGAVTYLEHIKHPISVARLVMEKTPHVILSGQGALDFAVSQGIPKENLLTQKSQQEYLLWLEKQEYSPKVNIERHDTIGMLAMDQEGQMSGGCSTSGLAYKMDGRVGDSPIIGAGLFLDNDHGCAVATGLGELVLKQCSSFLVVEFLRNGLSPQLACKKAIERIVLKDSNKNAQVGLIAVNKAGEVGAFSIQPGFIYTLSQGQKTQVLKAESYYK